MEPGEVFRGLFSSVGVRVWVSGVEIRLGIAGGVVYLNGMPAAQLLAEAQDTGGAVQVGRGAWELTVLQAAAYGLPPIRFLPYGSVRLGAGTYLRAQPDGNLFVGGPTLMEQDLVQLHPDPQFIYDGPGGVRFAPEEQGLRVLPQTQREGAFFAMGFALGWGFSVAVLQLRMLTKFVLRV